MRDGHNPNWSKSPCPPAPQISLTVHTHYSQHGYHKERYKIAWLCLSSMLAKRDKYNLELIIWDNGSPPKYREFLRSFRPDYFIEAPNVGPHNARLALCYIARGQYINLTDDDILYHPDWLDKMLEIYSTFPNVAVVSGSPINAEFARDFSPVHDWAAKTQGVKKTTGHNFIPKQWEQDWALSVNAPHGTSWQETYIEYKGVKAWAQAHHMQMFCPRLLIAKFLKARANILDFWNIAREISAAGHLQLTTFDRTAVHIGNTIDKSIERICDEWQIKRP